MSVLQVDIRSEQRRRLAAPALHEVQHARVDAAALCACTATSIPSPAGEVLVLRVDGEVDLLTIEVLQGALTSGLARGPRHLLVDVAELRFCSVRGLSLLVQAGRTAVEQGTGYSVAAASHQIDRAWTVLWPVSELPTEYPTAAAGVAAAIAGGRERWRGGLMPPPGGVNADSWCHSRDSATDRRSGPSIRSTEPREQENQS
jgi:anti-anti-sigma factor